MKEPEQLRESEVEPVERGSATEAEGEEERGRATLLAESQIQRQFGNGLSLKADPGSSLVPPDPGFEHSPQPASSSRLGDSEAVAVARQGLAGPSSEIPHKGEMEARGLSLEGVKAHTGKAATAAAGKLQAQAFTYGSDIGFATPSPTPELVAHELTHARQQSQGGAGDLAADEREAELAETRPAAKSIRPERHATTSAPELRLKGALPDDIDKSQVAGKPDEQPLTAEKVTKAKSFNDKKWRASQRLEILGYLRGAEAAEGDSFGDNDVQAAARIQKNAGCTEKNIDGMIGDQSMAIFLHAGLTITAPTQVKASQVQLLFYPGEFEDIEKWKAARDKAFKDKGDQAGYNEYRETSGNAPEGVGKIYVKVSGNLIAKMDARGGPAIKLKDGSHSADPSKAGSYHLGKGQPHRTNSWLYSQIRWGAEIREQDGEIQFKDPGAKDWKFATGSKCDLRDEIPRTAFYEGGKLVSTYKLNDFGAVAWRVEGSPGLFVHTTPTSEETTELGDDPILAHSHGCLHVKPAERDEMMTAGYLQKGVKLTIKHYEDHLLPETMRDKMTAGGPP